MALETALLDAMRDVRGLRALSVAVDTAVVELRVVALELPLPQLLAHAEKTVRAVVHGTPWANARIRLVVTDLDAGALATETGVTRSGSDDPR